MADEISKPEVVAVETKVDDNIPMASDEFMANWGSTPPTTNEPTTKSTPMDEGTPSSTEQGEQPIEETTESAEAEAEKSEGEPTTEEIKPPTVEELQTQIKEMQQKQQDLMNRLSDRGREVSAMEEQFKVEDQKRQSEAKEDWESRSRQAGGMVTEVITKMMNNPTDENGRPYDYSMMLGDAIMRSSLAAADFNMLQSGNYFSKARQNESLVLEKFPEFKEVSEGFNQFCLDRMQQTPDMIKQNPAQLVRAYQLCYDLSKGDPTKLREIEAKSKKLALESAARKKIAAKPGAGAKTVVKPKPTTDEDYQTNVTKEFGYRYDPNPYA